MTLHDPLLEDSRARLRALDLASFIVEAPAGAGKTELLTQRYLRLLAVVKNPEEVLALTFTNKAATEMRDRILGSLNAALLPLPADVAPHKLQTRELASAVLAHDKARAWGLLEHPGRLRITPLDALCASLARQMPLAWRCARSSRAAIAAVRSKTKRKWRAEFSSRARCRSSRAKLPCSSRSVSNSSNGFDARRAKRLL